MDRTITVSGRGSLRLPPDQIELPVNLRAEDTDYAAALKKGEKQLAELVSALTAAGVSTDCLRETEYAVSPVYDSEQDGRGRYRQVFRGYESRRSVRVRFDLDRALLGRTVAALAACESAPDFSVSFTLKDRESAKSALLAKAAQDAKRKAEALCAASDVRLGALLQVRCGLTEPEFYSRSNMRLAAAKMSMDGFGQAAPDPEEIEVEEEVVFQWGIE